MPIPAFSTGLPDGLCYVEASYSGLRPLGPAFLFVILLLLKQLIFPEYNITIFSSENEVKIYVNFTFGGNNL